MIRVPKPICRHLIDFTVTITLREDNFTEKPEILIENGYVKGTSVAILTKGSRDIRLLFK